MQSISENITTLKQFLSTQNVELVAVSKKKSVSDILSAYNAGQRIFGENVVQDLVLKKDQLPPDIQWHLIGHLQRNKVKYIAPFISMVQSVDSLRLLEEVQKQAEKFRRIVPCLLEIHIADEVTKNGLSYEEAEIILSSKEIGEMKNILICGLMGVATFSDNKLKIRGEFMGLHNFYKRIKDTYFTDDTNFRIVSMGMSADYKIAIEAGTNMVRAGSAIFGER